MAVKIVLENLSQSEDDKKLKVLITAKSATIWCQRFNVFWIILFKGFSSTCSTKDCWTPHRPRKEPKSHGPFHTLFCCLLEIWISNLLLKNVMQWITYISWFSSLFLVRPALYFFLWLCWSYCQQSWPGTIANMYTVVSWSIIKWSTRHVFGAVGCVSILDVMYLWLRSCSCSRM